MGLELAQLAPKVRFGLHPAALEIESSARQLAQNELGIVQAVLGQQDPELLGHVERRFRLSPRVPLEEAR